MLLYDLLRSLPARLDLAGVPNLDITGVREDSRQVRPGDLFVARPGTKTDGSQFLDAARRNGAAAARKTRERGGVGMYQNHPSRLMRSDMMEIDWPPFPSNVGLLGHPATEKDIEAGTAAFVLRDEQGRLVGTPVKMGMSRLGFINDGDS